MNKKNCVGSPINGWLILEELLIEYDVMRTRQRIRNIRRSRVENLECEYMCERNIA